MKQEGFDPLRNLLKFNLKLYRDTKGFKKQKRLKKLRKITQRLATINQF